MKKFLSAALAAVMVMSVVCLGIPASAATLDSQNMSINALRYDKGFTAYEMYGTTLKKMQPQDVLFTTNDEDPDAINLDGEILEEEWGKPTFIVNPQYSAKDGGKYASADNTYYYENTSDAKYKGPLSYKVWLRWDDSYLYVAAQVLDTDGGQNAKTGRDIHMGDCLQVRVDPKGPNSVVNGSGYVPRIQKYESDGHNSYFTLPWAGSILTAGGKNSTIETYSDVGNFGFAASTGSMKTEVYDMALRYNEHTEQVIDSAGAPVLDESGNPTYQTVWDPCDMYPGTNNPNGDAYAAVGVKGDRSYGYVTGLKTDYEVALPWTQVGSDFAASVGKEVGMSVGVLSAGTGGDINSYLAWGTGIFNRQVDKAADTAGGSNSVILSGDDYTTATCDHTTFAEPNCIDANVCTGCGYEIGFPVGHSYKFTDGVSVTDTTDGSMTATCPTCGDVQNITIPARKAEKLVAYDQNSQKGQLPGELSTFEIPFMNSRLDEKTPLVDENGNPRTSLTTTFDGYTVIDGTYPSFGTYFQVEPKEIYDKYKSNPEVEFDGSFAFDFDFYVTKWENNPYNAVAPDDEVDPASLTDTHYRNSIYQLFGGKNGLGFMAGYFAEDDRVLIMERTNDNEGKFVDENDKSKGQVPYKALAESEPLGLTTNAWHHFRTEYDFGSSTMFVYIDDQLAAYCWNPEFSLQAKDDLMGILRFFDTSLYLKDVTVSTISYGKTSTPPVEKFTATVNGVASEYSVGDNVALTRPALTINDGEENTNRRYRFYQWTVKSGDVTIENDSFAMPAGNVEVEAEMALVGDVNGDKKINNFDIIFLKRHLKHSMTLEGKSLASADVNGNGRVDNFDVLFLKRLSNGSFLPMA